MTTPPWVPQAPNGDFATLFGNFVTGQYWDGTGIVPVTGLFQEDTNIGTWDPAIIVPGSGVPTNGGVSSSPAFITALVAPLLAALPITLVVEYQLDVTGAGDIGALVYHATGFQVFDNEGYSGLDMPGAGVYNVQVADPDGSTSTPGPDANNPTAKIAATYDVASVVGSFNGGSLLASAGPNPPSPPDNVGIITDLSAVIANSFIRSIAVYPGQPSTSLPILSFVVPLIWPPIDFQKVQGFPQFAGLAIACKRSFCPYPWFG